MLLLIKTEWPEVICGQSSCMYLLDPDLSNPRPFKQLIVQFIDFDSMPLAYLDTIFNYMTI